MPASGAYGVNGVKFGVVTVSGAVSEPARRGGFARRLDAIRASKLAAEKPRGVAGVRRRIASPWAATRTGVEVARVRSPEAARTGVGSPKPKLRSPDAEGSVDIVDRKKDTIVTGGENVHSTEVEHVLHGHPDVLECAVVGAPDEHWGEAVTAVVVLRPGRTGDPASIISHARKRLARYKTPKRVDFVDELPKTGSGKIAKRVIRDWYRRGSEE